MAALRHVATDPQAAIATRATSDVFFKIWNRMMILVQDMRPRLGSGAIRTPGHPASKESQRCRLSVSDCASIARLRATRREANRIVSR